MPYAITVEWLDAGRKAENEPDPKYPEGVLVDLSRGRFKTCVVDVKYPAPGVGQHRIVCSTCGMSAVVTAAGRADDPRYVKLPCKVN